jgi:SAM-dependent methyltransferase
LYDGLAELYDWEHRDFQDDIPFYLSFAGTVPGPVLDAGCGTGRILVPLAKAGQSVTGVDLSADMLAGASAYAEREGVAGSVSLIRADLRSMDLAQRFGMALIALGSFHHLLTSEDQRSALQRLAACLVPRGLLILDLVNPTPEWLSAGDSALVHQYSGPFPAPDGPDWLTKLVARTNLFESQREESLLVYDRTRPDGTVLRHSLLMETRLLFRFEAEQLLAGQGFAVRDLYGSYDLGDYVSSSSRMIFVAERQ